MKKKSKKLTIQHLTLHKDPKLSQTKHKHNPNKTQTQQKKTIR